jgi:hypothetical protein
MRKDIFVYLSGPITAKHGYTVEENVAAATRVYWELLKRRIPAFCPHLCGSFPTAWAVIPYEAWLEYDYAVIDRCTHVLLLPRWETSAGALLELAYAEKQGKIIATEIDALTMR